MSIQNDSVCFKQLTSIWQSQSIGFLQHQISAIIDTPSWLWHSRFWKKQILDLYVNLYIYDAHFNNV